MVFLMEIELCTDKRPVSEADGSEGRPLHHPEDAASDAGAARELETFDVRRDGCQILPSLLLAASGLMLTGYVFEDVKQWSAFENTPEYFVMIPMLLGLKGSLDMTLASRLSTAAHLGVFEDSERTRTLVSASLALLQVQAIVCGLLTSLVGGVLHSDFELWNCLMLVANTLLTSCVAAFIFGVFTTLVVIWSTKLQCDPDNIAMPIISSLADVCTLLLLASVATGAVFTASLGLHAVFPIIIVVILAAWLPYMWSKAHQEPSCAAVCTSGWPPIFGQLVISQFAGMILKDSVEQYTAAAMLTPYINGVGGSLGCVYAGRLASSLHCGRSDREGAIVATLTVFDIFLQGGFLLVVGAFSLGDAHIDSELAFLYLTASLLQVGLVLAFVRYGTRVIFSNGYDPDNYMVPLLTALGDVLGTLFLLLALYWESRGSTEGGVHSVHV